MLGALPFGINALTDMKTTFPTTFPYVDTGNTKINADTGFGPVALKTNIAFYGADKIPQAKTCVLCLHHGRLCESVTPRMKTAALMCDIGAAARCRFPVSRRHLGGSR